MKTVKVPLNVASALKLKVVSSALVSRIEKAYRVRLKPGRNVLAGIPVDIEDSDGTYLNMTAVDRDGGKELAKDLRKKGFKVSYSGGTEIGVNGGSDTAFKINVKSDLFDDVEAILNSMEKTATLISERISDLGMDIQLAQDKDLKTFKNAKSLLDKTYQTLKRI